MPISRSLAFHIIGCEKVHFHPKWEKTPFFRELFVRRFFGRSSLVTSSHSWVESEYR